MDSAICWRGNYCWSCYEQGIERRDYAAVGFALASAISATTLIPLALSGSEIHSQVNWISAS